MVPSNESISYPVSRAGIASVQKPANPATATTKRCEEVDVGLKTTQHRRSTDPNAIPEALHHVLRHMHELDRPAIFHTEEQGHKRREGRILRESIPSVADPVVRYAPFREGLCAFLALTGLKCLFGAYAPFSRLRATFNGFVGVAHRCRAFAQAFRLKSIAHWQGRVANKKNHHHIYITIVIDQHDTPCTSH